MIQMPITSLYPEVDIATKITSDESDVWPFLSARSLSQLLWPLNNAGTMEIKRGLADERFYVRLSKSEGEEKQRIVISLEDNGPRLA